MNESTEIEVTSLSGMSVLVVEDNGLLSYVLEETLRGAGCTVVGPFSRLADAMQAAPSTHIDIALLDINLRGELVSPLADHLRERGVPYVVTSGYPASDLPRALQSASQLRKPFSDEDVLGRLASLVAEKLRKN